MTALLLGLSLAIAADPSAAATKHAAAPAAKPAAPAAAASGSDEAALKALDELWAAAFAKGDIERLLSYYADDAVLMDPGAMWAHGKEEIRKGFAQMFAMPGSREIRLHDTTHTIRGNVAWEATLWTYTEKGADGKATVLEGRACTVFEKRGGKWQAVLDHASVPMPPPPAAATPAAK